MSSCYGSLHIRRFLQWCLYYGEKDQGILALFLRRQKLLKTLIGNFGKVNQFNLDWTLALFCINVCCIS